MMMDNNEWKKLVDMFSFSSVFLDLKVLLLTFRTVFSCRCLCYRDACDWEGRGSAGGPSDHLHQMVVWAGSGALWEKHSFLSNFCHKIFNDCEDSETSQNQKTAD